MSPESDPAGGLVDFYEALAEHYHLLFKDWRFSVTEQGRLLAAFIAQRFRTGPLRILDCACGIGTQAIGLALQGHEVTASDLSPAAVARAAREALSFGVMLETGIADFRSLQAWPREHYDLALALDNAIPHLHTREDVLRAAANMAAVLAPGGMLMISIRDYDRVLAERPAATTPNVIDSAGGRRLVFQVWDWDGSGDSYALELFILQNLRGRWQIMTFRARYKAWRRQALTDLLSQANLHQIQWHLPEETGFYQPILTARRL